MKNQTKEIAIQALIDNAIIREEDTFLYQILEGIKEERPNISKQIALGKSQPVYQTIIN